MSGWDEWVGVVLLMGVGWVVGGWYLRLTPRFSDLCPLFIVYVDVYPRR